MNVTNIYLQNAQIRQFKESDTVKRDLNNYWSPRIYSKKCIFVITISSYILCTNLHFLVHSPSLKPSQASMTISSNWFRVNQLKWRLDQKRVGIASRCCVAFTQAVISSSLITAQKTNQKNDPRSCNYESLSQVEVISTGFVWWYNYTNLNCVLC